MYGAIGYLKGVESLNNICAMYKNDLAQEARSVKIEDINQAVGVIDENTIKEKNINLIQGYKQYGEKYHIENQYSPELWLNRNTEIPNITWIRERKKSTISGIVDAYRYAINCTDEEIPKVTVDETVISLLFDNVEYKTGKSYWVASRSVNAKDKYVTFCMGLVQSENDSALAYVGGGNMIDSQLGISLTASSLAVRPVVVLKSDVTEEDIQKIESQTEEVWNL